MKLIVKAPCCDSVRTCRDTVKYVVDIERKKVIAEIEAVRCYRGIERYYEVEVEEKKDTIVVVEHYVSNRNVHYLRFEYPKEPSSEVLRIVKEILGLIETVKLVVR